MKPVMIFHAPYPLNRQATSASGIRPVQMRDAFEANGYEVIEVAGTPKQRKAQIAQVRRHLADGKRIDFLYSESATIPTMLAGDKHLPPHPFLDISLFRLCKQHGIPTSLFYRDVYWAFETYEETVHPLLARVMRQIYQYDLRWYTRLVDTLYLPSEKMADYVPIFPKNRTKALPPGSQVKDILRTEQEGIDLLYIGGLSEHYRLHEAVRAVVATPDIRMTICTREKEWEAVRNEYEPLMDASISVVHRSGEGLAELYAQADICSLFVDPGEYRSFAAPVKLYEYIGHGLPVIASARTHAAEFVDHHRCGWSLEYSAQTLTSFLEEVRRSPQLLHDMRSSVQQERQKHTWNARAAQVADDMAALQLKATS